MTFFEFESDYVESLRCIPMQVRLKLDTCGIKLKLTHWHHFSLEQRQNLITLPCGSSAEISSYKTLLLEAITAVEGTNFELQTVLIVVEPVWQNISPIPQMVLANAISCGCHLSPDQWASLSVLQRFALVKLSRSAHENHNFLPALQEFKLLPQNLPKNYDQGFN